MCRIAKETVGMLELSGKDLDDLVRIINLFLNPSTRRLDQN